MANMDDFTIDHLRKWLSHMYQEDKAEEAEQAIVEFLEAMDPQEYLRFMLKSPSWSEIHNLVLFGREGFTPL